MDAYQYLLDQLSQHRQQGQITQEEYQQRSRFLIRTCNEDIKLKVRGLLTPPHLVELLDRLHCLTCYDKDILSSVIRQMIYDGELIYTTDDRRILMAESRPRSESGI